VKTLIPEFVSHVESRCHAENETTPVRYTGSGRKQTQFSDGGCSKEAAFDPFKSLGMIVPSEGGWSRRSRVQRA